MIISTFSQNFSFNNARLNVYLFNKPLYSLKSEETTREK